MKILCLGNEFIKEDSFAKEIGKELEKQGYFIINIKDSFELIEELTKLKQEKKLILDVVEKIKNVKELRTEDLRQDAIVSAHDFDAGFVLNLINSDVKIIGIPQEGDIGNILKEVKDFL
ncbi:MAG: hypothetical protein ACP5OG_05750 [Candidatus Nanoarchaeia archaeon]